MKNHLIIILLFFLTNCKKESIRPKPEIDNNKKNIVKNEVVFTLKGFQKPLPINIKSSLIQIKPDLIIINNNKNQNSIVIPTDSLVSVFIGSKFYILKGIFTKGDSVVISHKKYFYNRKKIAYPYFNISNRKVNLFELNFDYYVARKTHTKYSFPIYHRFAMITNKTNKMETYEDVYNNTIRVNDSLFTKNLISKEFHKKELQEIKIFRANFILNQAVKSKRKVNINSLEISLSDNSLFNNKLYIDYLITSLKYRYFFNKKRRISYTEVFNTFLEKKDYAKDFVLKKAIVNELLSRIYEYPNEKKHFKNCLKKLNKDEFPSLIKKFETILVNEKRDRYLMASLKNATGKLLFFNEEKQKTIDYHKVLKKSIGKVVLVDFWASWCAPCRYEIPSLKKLQREIDSSKFSVISISTDKKISAWKKASKIENLEKTNNFLLINSKKSSLIKIYKINSIPRYLLYDKKGKLINENAPKPSSKELKALIDKYLKE